MGSEILVRAEKMMEEELEDAARARKYMEVDVDVNDTVTEWCVAAAAFAELERNARRRALARLLARLRRWTGTDAADSEADVEERLMDLFTSLQFADGARARRLHLRVCALRG